MYSPLIVAKNAVLKFAQGQQFNLMEGNNIFGSFRWVQNNADYAFWIGGTEGSTATTSITRGGKFKTTDADITGKITATSGQIGGFKLEDNNLVCSNARLVIGEERNTFTRMVVLDAKSFTYDSYNFALSVVNYGIVTQSSTTQAGIHINVGASNTSVQYPGIVMEMVHSLVSVFLLSHFLTVWICAIMLQFMRQECVSAATIHLASR